MLLEITLDVITIRFLSTVEEVFIEITCILIILSAPVIIFMKDSVEQDYFNSLKSRLTLSRITIAPAIDFFDSDNKQNADSTRC